MSEHEVRANHEHSALVAANRRRVVDTSEAGG
jgi:hypothetical protein